MQEEAAGPADQKYLARSRRAARRAANQGTLREQVPLTVGRKSALGTAGSFWAGCETMKQGPIFVEIIAEKLKDWGKVFFAAKLGKC